MAPDFLSEFGSSLAKQQEALKEKILKGKPNPLQNQFEKYFVSHWIKLDQLDRFSEKPSNLGIMAVDSSLYTNLFSTGGIFYVIRSLAVCRSESRKLLETDVFFTRGNFNDAQRFIGRKMEMLEFQVAIDTLKEECNCQTILIDGSLYGRIAHLPIETPIEDQRLMLLDYFQTYHEFLDLCKEKHVMPIGVSKESRSTFYRDFLLRLIFKEELEKLTPDIDSMDLQRLEQLFPEFLDREQAAFKRFSKLKTKYADKLNTIQMIFEELTSSRPDYQLLMNMAKTTGYTQPMLHGPSTKIARILDLCWRDPEKYVRSHFPVTYREQGKSFVERASGVLTNLMTLPSMVSLYLLLDTMDSPIRIDMPCWDQNFSKTGWPKPIDFNIDSLLKVMVTGYCGLDGYNLWLKNVDERVRLKKRTVDTIYFPLMEQKFNAKIIRGRSYRRVKYP